MICKHCGTENPDNFKFCHNCGGRLDGKRVCTTCGAEIDEGAKFCGFCGKSINGNFAVPEKPVADVPEAKPAQTAKMCDWKKIVTYVSWGCIGFAALIGLIFTFCIGITGNEYRGGALSDSSTATIYYYFGEAYKQLGEATTVIEYIPVVIKTVLSAAALICGVVFAIITVVKCIKQFVYKKEGVSFVKPALLTYLSFALFASAYLVSNAVSYKESLITQTTYFSAATLAGLVLGGLATGFYFVGTAAIRIAEYKNVKVIVNSVIAFVTAVFALVVASLTVMPVCSVDYSGNFSDSVGFLSYITASARYEEMLFTVSSLCLASVGFIVQLLLMVFTVKVLYSSAVYATEGRKCKTLGFAITNVVLAVVQLSIAVVLFSIFNFAHENAYTASYGMPIAVLVLSVVVLVGTIILKVFTAKKDKAEAEPVQQQQD